MDSSRRSGDRGCPECRSSSLVSELPVGPQFAAGEHSGGDPDRTDLGIADPLASFFIFNIARGCLDWDAEHQGGEWRRALESRLAGAMDARFTDLEEMLDRLESRELQSHLEGWLNLCLQSQIERQIQFPLLINSNRESTPPISSDVTDVLPLRRDLQYPPPFSGDRQASSLISGGAAPLIAGVHQASSLMFGDFAVEEIDTEVTATVGSVERLPQPSSPTVGVRQSPSLMFGGFTSTTASDHQETSLLFGDLDVVEEMDADVAPMETATEEEVNADDLGLQPSHSITFNPTDLEFLPSPTHLVHFDKSSPVLTDELKIADDLSATLSLLTIAKEFVVDATPTASDVDANQEASNDPPSAPSHPRYLEMTMIRLHEGESVHDHQVFVILLQRIRFFIELVKEDTCHEVKPVDSSAIQPTPQALPNSSIHNAVCTAVLQYLQVTGIDLAVNNSASYEMRQYHLRAPRKPPWEEVKIGRLARVFDLGTDRVLKVGVERFNGDSAKIGDESYVQSMGSSPSTKLQYSVSTVNAMKFFVSPVDCL